MSKKFPIYLLATLMSASLWTSCNSDSDEATAEVKYGSVAVEGFSLKPNDKILEHLDSVFFSIDLEKAVIYNADSLPVGTDVSRLTLNIKTTSVGAVELIVPRPGMTDTTYNYLSSQNDSIDFSHGPVTLRITARDRTASRDYKVSVNVHRMNPDSLTWDNSVQRRLPSALSAPTAQKTVIMGDKFVCMTTDASGAASIATADDPDGQWSRSNITLPAGADIATLAATPTALYLTTDANRLMKSTDTGATWADAGIAMTCPFGAVGDNLIGTVNRGGTWSIVNVAPDGSVSETEAPAAFPVMATSVPVVYTTKWSNLPTAIIVGGIKADGNPTGVAWAWDGKQWAMLNDDSRGAMPALSGLAVIPYFAYRVSTATWSISRESILLAFGGLADNGLASTRIYISWDRGLTWAPGGSKISMPLKAVPFHSAQAFVFDSTITPKATARVSRPITEWNCPYIYLFGGMASDGTLVNSIERGVINRLTFKPLY